jgi:hypothetical protein
LTKSTLEDARAKKFENFGLNHSAEEIRNKMKELIVYDVELLQEKSAMAHNIKCIKKSLH